MMSLLLVVLWFVFWIGLALLLVKLGFSWFTDVIASIINKVK